MENLKMAFENDYPNRQTIDRESGTYLRHERGINHPNTHIFSFYWKGERMEFYAEENPKYDDNNKEIAIDWTFFQVDIPPYMQDKREEIAGMIKQALEEYGYSYDKTGYERVTATFTPPS